MVAITVMVILLTASAQAWTTVMKREREEELIFRGNQYIKALLAYKEDHGGAFPTDLEQLMETGPRGHRYIRQIYVDPFSEDGTWNLLYLGPDGKSAFNPKRRLAQGVPGLPGQGSNAGGGLSSPASRSSDPRGGPQGSGSRGRKSGFSSGNLNTPIVGVVSQGPDKAFQEYFGKQYYDEWEFHVFLVEVPRVQRGQGQRIDLIPGRGVGPRGKLLFVDPNAPRRPTGGDRPLVEPDPLDAGKENGRN